MMFLLLGRRQENKWRLEHLLSFKKHFLLRVVVVVVESNVIEVTMVIQSQQHPHFPPRFAHPHFLTRTKKQILLWGIPSVAWAAAGFTIWSEQGLGERVPHWGSLLRYASARICWAEKSHKTMLISGILNTLQISFSFLFFSARNPWNGNEDYVERMHYVTFHNTVWGP